MAARGLFCKSLFLSNLIRPSRVHLFSPSRTSLFQSISKEKTVFKPLYWYRNEKDDIDATIDRAGYQSYKTQEEKKYTSVFLRAFYLVSLTFGYVFYSSATAYAGTHDDEKENSVGDTSGRYKGYFVSKRRLSAVKNLADCNLKRPMPNENKAEEKDFEPARKRVTRSKQVSSFSEERCCKCCKLARITFRLR